MLDTVVSSNENRRFAFAKGSPRLYRRGRMSLDNITELSERICDCISDGYDDEEWREDAIDKMTVALEKCPDEDIIIAFTRLCERVEEFMA